MAGTPGFSALLVERTGRATVASGPCRRLGVLEAHRDGWACALARVDR